MNKQTQNTNHTKKFPCTYAMYFVINFPLTCIKVNYSFKRPVGKSAKL